MQSTSVKQSSQILVTQTDTFSDSLRVHFTKASKVVEIFKSKENDFRYLGCFVFGSYADGHFSQFSDLDIILVVEKEEYSKPYEIVEMEGINVDLSVDTLEQVINREESILKKAERRTWLADSLIIFDTKGLLKKLKRKYSRLSKPAILNTEALILYRKDIQKMNQKIEQSFALSADDCSFILSTCIRDLVDIHYKVSGRFTVQAKKIFADLGKWDIEFANNLRSLINATSLSQKLTFWNKLTFLVLKGVDLHLNK